MRLKAISLVKGGPQVPLVWYDEHSRGKPIVGIIDLDGQWLAAFIRAPIGGPIAQPIPNQPGVDRA